MKKDISEYNSTKKIDLIESSFILSEGEHKLVNLAISKLDSHKEYLSKVSIISVKEYASITGLNIDPARRILKRSMDSLWEKEIVWKDEEGEFTCRWLQEKGLYKEGNIYLKWTDRVFNSITNLKGSRYVQLVNKHSMVLKSKYSIRMFELLLAERYVNNWDKEHRCYIFTWSLDEVQYRLALSTSISVYKSFKVLVLDKTVKELLENNIAIVSYFPLREGRVIKHIQFKITWLIDKKGSNYSK